MDEAQKRLGEVQKRIEQAALEAGRRPEDISLIAVSKTFDAAHIKPVIEAGQRLFGENRVQEAKGKWPQLIEQYGEREIELHLIGPLQSNKAAEAVALFDVIHTVDREKIARALKKQMQAQGRNIRLLVQVNTGEEPQKAGLAPRETSAFVRWCVDELKLDIVGLMCIPPVNEEAALHFTLLKKMADELGLPQTSMGMSADYETAAALGATCVRVGSAIFGGRD